MFWKYNYAVSPQIEQLLEKEDITLVELMEEEDILQECKAQNKKLVEFLLRSTTLEQLVTLIITEPSGDIEETSRYRLSNIACEILTCDLPALNERLSADKAILEKLYAFIKQEPPLNPLLCSFFSKTLAMLITRHSEQNWYSYQFSCLQVVEFLKSQEDCVTTLLRHIATPAIMDLLFKLLSQVEGNEMRKSVIEWLNNQNIVPCLVNLLRPEHGNDIHCNVSQLLCDVVRADKELRLENADIDCILTALETPETVSLVLNNILREPKMESSIVGGIQFLLVLFDQSIRSTSQYNDFKKDKLLDNNQQELLIAALEPHLHNFHNILLNPPQRSSIRTTVGLLEVPLGNARLQIIRFICTLLSESPPLTSFCNKLAELGIIETLLDLFFMYSWNNFLHGYIEKVVASIIQCADSELTSLQKILFDQGKIIQRMLEGWNNNICQHSNEKGIRKAYMGHIIKILNHVESVKSELLKEFIKDVLSKDTDVEEAWSTFISGPLKNANEIQNTLLGGVHPAHCKSDELSIELKEEMPSICFGNFDEDNLDNTLESKLDVFMNGLSMTTMCNDTDANDDWQFNGNDFALKSNDDPWGDVVTKILSSPVTNDNECSQEASGWADFSCENFADFDSNICQFNDTLDFTKGDFDSKTNGNCSSDVEFVSTPSHFSEEAGDLNKATSEINEVTSSTSKDGESIIMNDDKKLSSSTIGDVIDNKNELESAPQDDRKEKSCANIVENNSYKETNADSEEILKTKLVIEFESYENINSFESGDMIVNTTSAHVVN